MNIITETIVVEAQQLTLTNQRAIFWERENALILSDLHIGKTAHFRRHGIPMPDGVLNSDLQRLENLIAHFKPKKLIVVGDLFHAEANIDFKTFKNWLMQFASLEIILIKGNHDRLSKQTIRDFKLKLESELKIPPFTFVHEHTEKHQKIFTVSGHTHPGVLIKGRGRQRLKLPCYQVSKNQIVLPAFSLFTGLNTKNSPADCLCYAFTNEAIFKL